MTGLAIGAVTLTAAVHPLGSRSSIVPRPSLLIVSEFTFPVVVKSAARVASSGLASALLPPTGRTALDVALADAQMATGSPAAPRAALAAFVWPVHAETIQKKAVRLASMQCA